MAPKKSIPPKDKKSVGDENTVSPTAGSSSSSAVEPPQKQRKVEDVKVWTMLPVEKEVSTIEHRYLINRQCVQLRTTHAEWCAPGQVLKTTQKKTVKQDQGVEKIKKKFYELARPQVVEEEINSDPFFCTPSTPEGIVAKVEKPLTQQERERSLNFIKAQPGGVPIEETNMTLKWKVAGGSWSHSSLVVSVGDDKRTRDFNICITPECFSYQGTLASEAEPRCSNDKGPKSRFVIAEYTDNSNKDEIVIFHVMALFVYESETMKRERAVTCLKNQISRSPNNPWPEYVAAQETNHCPTPTRKEVRMLCDFETEEEATKVFSAWQSVTLMRKLIEPNTTIQIRYLNKMVNLPNGAEKEVIEEMDKWGVNLSVSSVIDDEAERASISYPFGIKRQGYEGLASMVTKDEVGALYVVSNPHINYFGKTISGYNLHLPTNTNDTVTQYSNKSGSLPWELIPLGSCPLADLEKNEAHLHVCNMFAHLLKLRQSFVSKDPPYKYPAGQVKKNQSHPICLNKSTNCKFFDNETMIKVNLFMKKFYGVGINLGPND